MAVVTGNSTTFATVNGSATSVINSVPSGVIDDDLLLWTVTAGGSPSTSLPSIPTPSGWGIWAPLINNGTLGEIVVFYRWASSEPPDYTISGLGAKNYNGIMTSFRGVHRTNPQDATPTEVGGGTSPAITTTCDGVLLVVHGTSVTATNIPAGGTYTSSGTIAAQVSQTQAAASNLYSAVTCLLKTNTGAAVLPTLAGNNVVAGSTVRISSALRPAAPAHISTRDALGTSSAATVTATYSGALNVGDFLIASLYYNVAAGRGTMPAGWVLIGEQPVGNLTSDGVISLYYKIAGISEPTSVIASATGATLMRLGIHAYRNVDTTSPFEMYGSNTSVAASVNSMLAASSALTLLNTNDLVFVVWAGSGSVSAQAVDSGFTLRSPVARLSEADASSVASGINPTLTWTTAVRMGSMIAVFKSDAPAPIASPSVSQGKFLVFF